MLKSVVYYGNASIGEVEISSENTDLGSWAREIRIAHLSVPSERCPPLAVFHTIAAGGPCLRMESRQSTDAPPPPIVSMHDACLRENKTAVVPLGEEELHLVAMKSGKNLMNYACFWGFKLPAGLYNPCLNLLNLRCLGIVFDLDETLIVANTTRSFEDRIDALQRKVSNEMDPQRASAMSAEIKRYQDDRSILKQYIEGDQVIDNGRVYKAQSEVVPPLSDNHQLMTRPIIRLQEKGIILTRINTSIRDTSVLVRLRPAWEDLRSYLIARGRKRFEVYVCTMAERDYALEMWRLLDPDFRLINSTQLLDRIVCVKAGSRKSLFNVFYDGSCHPGMALVIDDRLKVWDEKDQCRVHVVPAFSPYYAPQAEANSTIPILCVARNVACNVRGGFFKEFDEGLLPRIAELMYEDVIKDFPSAPDVGNYLISEEENSGNRDPLSFDGMADAEVERRMKEAYGSVQAVHPVPSTFEMNPIPPSQQIISCSSGASPVAGMQSSMLVSNNQSSQPVPFSRTVPQPALQEPSLQASPAREEGEVPESELDPDTRRRLLILQHGQDTRDPPPPPPTMPPHQVSVPPVQSRGNWFQSEDEMNTMNLNRDPNGLRLEPEKTHYDKKQAQHPSFFPGGDGNPISSDRFLSDNRKLPAQVSHGDGHRLLQNNAPPYRSFTGEEPTTGRFPSSQRRNQMASGRPFAQYAETSAGVLQQIAIRCGSKVEYRSALCDTTELKFSIEVWLVGEKMGEGIGNTRKEAQRQAAEISLRNLANKYFSDSDKTAAIKENGFISDPNSYGYQANMRDDILPVASTSEESRFMNQRNDGSRKATASVAALKELCTVEGFSLVFQAPPLPPDSSMNKVYAQVEIAGQILGKGVGATWDEAKLQAADEALDTLKSMLGQLTQKRSGSPRSHTGNISKRPKPDFMRAVQRVPSGRYSRTEGRVP